jgi:Mrp family chromosome partitioning ATPase
MLCHLSIQYAARIHISQGLPKRGEPPVMPRRGLPPKRGIPNVKKIIAVASGKGGVGKSTVAGLSLSILHMRSDM